MTFPKKKIALIGGGFAGILSLVALKEEGGFEPVCFEKTSVPGGTWCYRETSPEGVASTMRTTIINISKEMGAISNYPPRKESNNFMRHFEVLQYFMEYANSRDVLKHIQFNTEVVEVKRSVDYDETGQWSVTVKKDSGQLHTDIYDDVMVCVGHINRPKMPTYPGQDLFKGEIMHTHSLKEVLPFKDKNIVVVGMGCSGLDAAVESSSVAKQVYISTRSGAHVISRIGPHGYPFDYILVRRYLTLLLDIFPAKIVSKLLESAYLDVQFNRRMYAIKPNHHILCKDPSVNDHIGSKLLSGSVIQKPGIKCFTEDGIIFEGEDEVTEADVVIMATGYTWKFPFLEEGIVVEEGDVINLYKCIFPPHLKHSTLAIIAFILPMGPGFPLAELQCRWAVQVLAGNCKLPTEKKMRKEIKKRHKNNLSRYIPGDKMSLHVDYVQYCDDIASKIGVKPCISKLFFTDPRLWVKLVFGPCVSYQYRLKGLHKWDGARQAIMTCKERMIWPITKRKPKAAEENIIKTSVKKIPRAIFF